MHKNGFKYKQGHLFCKILFEIRLLTVAIDGKKKAAQDPVPPSE